MSAIPRVGLRVHFEVCVYGIYIIEYTQIDNLART